MKTRLFLMAMAGVALAGCVSEEVANVKQNQEQKKVIIGFDAPVMYDNAESRVVTGEMGTTYDKNEAFRIFAKKYDVTTGYTGWDNAEETAFYGNSISYDNSLDGWAPRTGENGYYYWEKDVQMVFAACSPASELTSATYGASGLTITDFKVKDEPAEQYDLLFSQRVYDADASDMNHSSTYYSGVPFVFQHALSSVHVAIENETLSAENPADRVEVRLLSINFINLHNIGTFNENLTDATSATDPNKEYRRTDRNNGEGNVAPKWELVNGAQAYSIYQKSDANPTGLVFPEYSNHIVEYLEDIEEDGDWGTANYLLVMPQSFETNTSAAIEIHYTVAGKENSKTIHLNELPVKEWKIGYKYIYNLKYSLASAKLDKIIFSPSVEGWPEGEIIDVDIK